MLALASNPSTAGIKLFCNVLAINARDLIIYGLFETLRDDLYKLDPELTHKSLLQLQLNDPTPFPFDDSKAKTIPEILDIEPTTPIPVLAAALVTLYGFDQNLICNILFTTFALSSETSLRLVVQLLLALDDMKPGFILKVINQNMLPILVRVKAAILPMLRESGWLAPDLLLKACAEDLLAHREVAVAQYIFGILLDVELSGLDPIAWWHEHHFKLMLYEQATIRALSQVLKRTAVIADQQQGCRISSLDRVFEDKDLGQAMLAHCRTLFQGIMIQDLTDTSLGVNQMALYEAFKTLISRSPRDFLALV